MHRRSLQAALERYRTSWLTDYDSPEEFAILERFENFVATTPKLFDNATLPGHITGSAMVVSADLSRVLLTLHGKLNKWLQLGGHSDGHNETHEVALREAYEESGLPALDFLRYEQLFGSERSLLGQLSAKLIPPLPFDFDAHFIPARPAKNEPEHYHFDVRYLIVAGADERVAISDESHDLRWFDLALARQVTDERSMHRQFEKLVWLKSHL